MIKSIVFGAVMGLSVLAPSSLLCASDFGFDKMRSIEKLRYDMIKGIYQAKSTIKFKNYPNLNSSDSVFRRDALVNAILKAAERGTRIEMVYEGREVISPLTEQLALVGIFPKFKKATSVYGEFSYGDQYVIMSNKLFVVKQKGDGSRIVSNSTDVREGLNDFKYDMTLADAEQEEEDFWED